MPIEIPVDSNFLIMTQYRTTRGTAMVPLLKPMGFEGKKTTATAVELPANVIDLATHINSNVYKIDHAKFSGKNSTLAVLDTGVYAKHPDFGDRVVLATNYKGDTRVQDDIADVHGHGTHVAGLAAGAQSKRFKQFSGIAPNASIVSVKVTDKDSDITSWRKIADGVDWVLQYNAKDSIKPGDKIGCILICFNAYDSFNSAEIKDVSDNRLFKLFKDCYDSGVTVVVSSGNHYLDFCTINAPGRGLQPAANSEPTVIEHNGLAYPAIGKHAIAVGATANDSGTYRLSRRDMPSAISFNAGDMAIFSQRMRSAASSSSIPNPFFVCTPGMQMVSLDHRPESVSPVRGKYPQGYTVMSGTSQAAAVMAGMVLLLQEAYRKKHHTSDGRVPCDVIFMAVNAGSISADFDSMGHSRNALPGASPRYKVFDLKSAITYINTH